MYERFKECQKECAHYQNENENLHVLEHRLRYDESQHRWDSNSVSAALWPTDDLPQKSEAHCYTITKRHAKINAIDKQYADYCCNREDSDQPAHPLSRITSFFIILYTGWM